MFCTHTVLFSYLKKEILIIGIAVEYFCIIGTYQLHFSGVWSISKLHSSLTAMQIYV